MDVEASFLEQAVLRAGGTSGGAIKRAVTKILGRIAAPKSRLVDIGAGRGELLMSLDRNDFSDLTGVDYLERPENLPSDIAWRQMNLNTPVPIDAPYDVVVCSETIEHLENPRNTMRYLASIASKCGHIIITMPNQESLRSYGSLLSHRHFVQFRDECYPAHITALLEKDVCRIANEVGWEVCALSYSDSGHIPLLTKYTWQAISFGRLRGRFFSDNVAFVLRRKS